MNQFWESLRANAGSILLGFAALVLLIGVGFAFYMLITLVGKNEVIGPLPLLAIGGVIVLILMLTVVAMIFSILDLTNRQQALGLPEGSIRAVIALSLIVLFAILSVFLYQGVSRGPLNTIENLTEAERSQFLQNHPTARDIRSTALKKPDGTAVKNKNNEDLYTVSYGSTNTTADDFAKQLLVLLGTLMTAVTSFYLGAGTATTAAQVGQVAGQTAAAAGTTPTVSGIKPTSLSISKDGPMAHLEIMGANLNVVTHVKIERAGATPLIGTNVRSNPTSVTCDIPVNATTTPPGGAPWDVVVDDGGSKSATLPGALTITA